MTLRKAKSLDAVADILRARFQRGGKQIRNICSRYISDFRGLEVTSVNTAHLRVQLFIAKM